MSQNQDAMTVFKQRRERNLAYFKEHCSYIYDYFKNYKLKQLQVNILPGSDEVDLLSNGRSIYNGRAKQYAKDEVAEFKKVYDKGSKLFSFRPPFKDEYDRPRFFARAANKIIYESSLASQNYQGYTVPEFYPCIVFMGSGLGYHIEEFLTQSDVNSVYILEPDTDRFAASLYAVDWEKICDGREPNKSSAISFLVGDVNDPENEELILWGALWNNLIINCPAFPIMTIFYNHMGDNRYDRITDKVNEDMMVYLMSWGNYDDELNQLNQAIHNFTLGINIIPDHRSEFDSVPVCIIGAGPSLDDRIKDLKAVKDRVIIISCGTALKSLYVNGIKPDIHVEVESDYIVTDFIKKINDDAWVRSIKMIGPSQINPCVFDLFEHKRIYFKRESGISHFFGREEDTIADGTPTCTNMALALACHYQAKSVFLFGMDFAFKNIQKHHAVGSPYYDADVKETLLQGNELIVEVDVFPIDGVNDQKLFTNAAYYTAKRKADNLVRNSPDEVVVKNCSDGAEIEHAEWTKSDDFIDQVSSASTELKARYMAYLFGGEGRMISQAEIDRALDVLSHTLDEFINDAELMLNRDITDLKILCQVCFRLNWYMESVVQQRVPEFYYFMRGSVRHFLYIVFSHALSLDDKEERDHFILEWREGFTHFLNEVGPHFRSIVFKKYDIKTDPWVSKALSEPE